MFPISSMVSSGYTRLPIMASSLGWTIEPHALHVGEIHIVFIYVFSIFDCNNDDLDLSGIVSQGAEAFLIVV